ncbi:MAG TPA: Cys-tRNA(Pro) deacylase [Bryobacteraceae bacterium]|nr:Cys-tRNA(Pro) deacylase [Bryobacteraceae bacterium]
MKKTNAVRILESQGVAYETREYKVDAEDLSAPKVAEAIGLPAEQVFKTLVARGDKTGVLLACLPGSAELSLKALARASGNKTVELAAVKEIQNLTGYIRGGVSPVGAKKPYPVYLDDSAGNWPVIAVSAGVRGCQMLVAPGDLSRVAGATLAGIVMK